MKNVFDGLISRLDMTKKRISELEVKSIKSAQPEMQRAKRMKKARNRISKQWRTTAERVTCIMGRQKEKRERERGAEETFEVIVAENCLKIMTDMKPQIQKTQTTLSRINTHTIPRHVITKLQNMKDGILTKADEKDPVLPRWCEELC